ncbi:MAG TPA: glycosyltransferase family 39 protein, partial [Tepidisphaeraceae bacterium]
GYAPDRAGAPYRATGNTFDLIAYFPLVPLVSRAMSRIMPLDVAMVVFSNLCSLIGFGFLFDWARRLVDARTATICVLITATFPGAVAIAAGMTEGPFLMLVAMALWLLQRKRFYGAAVAAGIATATRPTGVALAMVVVLYAWTQLASEPLARRMMNVLVLGLISFSGTIAYEAFLWHRYETPTAYSQAQSAWTSGDDVRMARDTAGGVKRYSWEFFRSRLLRPQGLNRLIGLAVLVVTVAGLLKPVRIPRVYFLLPLVIVVMTCLPGRGLRISSLPRYESGAVPLFLLMAIWLRAQPRRALLVGLLLLQMGIQIYYAILFPREIWVG